MLSYVTEYMRAPNEDHFDVAVLIDFGSHRAKGPNATEVFKEMTVDTIL